MLTLSMNQLCFLVIIIIGVWILYPYFEGFDVTTSEFVPIGSPRHGLRGDLLKQHWIGQDFMSDYRQILLNDTDGEMWSSNWTPAQQGLKNCGKTGCPQVNGYDKMDTCYRCKTDPPQPQTFEVWPHVKN